MRRSVSLYLNHAVVQKLDSNIYWLITIQGIGIKETIIVLSAR